MGWPLRARAIGAFAQRGEGSLTSGLVTGRRFLLISVRVGVPLAIAVAGVVAIVIGHGRASSPTAAAGVALIIAAIIVWMLNWMNRMSVQSNQDRDREEEARAYIDAHGRWPDRVMVALHVPPPRGSPWLRPSRSWASST